MWANFQFILFVYNSQVRNKVSDVLASSIKCVVNFIMNILDKASKRFPDERLIDVATDGEES